jgi:orotate phosphoribosyltransferase
MTPPPPRKDSETMDAEVREKIHLEILKRTGAYHANDHILLPSGQHTTEYIEKTLVTTEPSFTEGLGAVIAKHFAPWPIDVVVSTGPGALILSPLRGAGASLTAHRHVRHHRA